MLRVFKSSTALVASLSLAVPHGAVLAQEATQEPAPAMICADGTRLPCAEGVEAIPVPPGQAPAEGQAVPPAEPAPEPAPDQAEEPAAEQPAEQPAPEAPAAQEEPAEEPAAEQPAEQPAPEEPATPEEPAAQEPAAEEPAVTEEPAEPEVAPATGEAPAAEEQPAAEEPAVLEETPATEEPPATEEQPAAEEPVGAPPADAPATEEGTVDPDAPTAEELEETPSVSEAEQPAEPAPDSTGTEEQPAAEEPAAMQPTGEVTAPEAETAPAEPTAEELEKALEGQSGAATETPAETGDLPVVNPATADIVEELAAEGNLPSQEVVPELPVQPEAETGEAPVAEAAQILASPTDGQEAGSATAPVPDEAVAQVTEEEVTADTARASSEDFANKVNEAATAAKAAKVAQPQVVDRKKGLSDTEKLLLLGAGALVVGAILSNNRRVEMNSGDRVIVSRDGQYYVLKDDDALLRQPGSKVRTETFFDGSTRTTVTRPDGSRIVTIRDAEQRVLRRVHVAPDGRENLLIDDTIVYEPVLVSTLPKTRPRPVDVTTADEEALRAALAATSEAGRRFSLSQVRNIWEVRSLVPVIDLDTITFESGSAAIRPDQAKALAGLGKLIQSYIRRDASEIFLIEGHTDAEGSAAYNLALSDRRAESVALALTEYFGIPPENLVVQGYGESFLKVDTQGDERANRRASVRRITSLLR